MYIINAGSLWQPCNITSRTYGCYTDCTNPAINDIITCLWSKEEFTSFQPTRASISYIESLYNVMSKHVR